MATIEEELEQLKAQQALQSAALRRILEGKLEGADGAAALVVALEGGQTSITVRLGKDDTGAEPTPAPAPTIVHLPSQNYSVGRPSGPPIALVIHTMAGSLAGTDSWFRHPSSQVSAHYGVGLGGEIHQYVQLGDRAWANGVREAGNNWNDRALPIVNPNDLTVSIETEDRGGAWEPVTDAQFDSVYGIAAAAVSTYPSIRYLLRHADISPRTRPNCPGPRWVDSGSFAQLAGVLGLETFL